MLNMKQISKLKHICKNTRIIDPDTYYYDIFIPDSGLGDGKFKLIFCKYGSIHDYSKLLKKLLKKDEITDQVIHEDVFWASPNDTEYVNFVNISKFTPERAQDLINRTILLLNQLLEKHSQTKLLAAINRM